MSAFISMGVAATAGHGLAQSGVRDSLDDAQILVNKDVGGERWAIAYDRTTGTVTGNVFFPDGRAPAFIWCAQTGEPGAIEPGAPDLELSCHGSDACDQAPCAGPAWSFIADVTLPVSFFLADTPTPNPTAAPTPSPTAAPTASPEPTAMPTPAVGNVPASPDALFTFLRSRAYESFAAESSVHPTNAPHMSAVRTFLNPLLESSLEAQADSHPVGAAAVKELYDGTGALAGWAAMVKIADSDGDDGNAWYWYEVFDTEVGSSRIEGVGSSVCTPCHAAGSDYIRVPFPLQ